MLFPTSGQLRSRASKVKSGMYQSTSGRYPTLSVPQAPDQHAPWPVDLIHLRRYTMGDQQLETEVLGLFAGELPKTLARIRASASDREWREAAHTLKGSARAVGAWHVARAAQAAEKLDFASASEVARQAAVEPIEVAVAEALAFIRDLAPAH